MKKKSTKRIIKQLRQSKLLRLKTTVIMFLCVLSVNSIAQNCTWGSQSPAGTVNVSSTSQTIVGTNVNPGTYSVENFTVAGQYALAASFGSYFTVTDNANNPIISGPNTLTVTIPSPGLYRIHFSANSGCGTGGGSRIVALVPVNRALDFDGVDDYVDLGTPLTTYFGGKTAITAEAWIYPTSNTGAYKVIIGNYNTTNNTSPQFMLRQQGNDVSFFIGNSSGSYAAATASNSLTLNSWQHVVGTWDGSVIKVYVNGVLGASTNWAGSMYTTSNAVYIGKNNFTNEIYQGKIDEVRVWDRALCQGEIQNNRNGEIPTTSTNLLANYHFNQGVASGTNTSVTSLTDNSGNSYTGTLTNFALTGSASNWIAPGAFADGIYVTSFVSPSVSISGANGICLGASTTFTASGNVSTYNWLSGPTTATNNVSPTTATTYSVVGTNSLGCLSNTATITLNVNSLPTISVNSGSICSGQAFTMIPGGASTYTFSGGSSVVSPTANTSYTVTGTNASGCVSSTGAVSSVTVNSLPVISVNSGSICSGTSFTMIPTGALTYTYTGGSAIVSPTTTTSYSVTGTNASGCVSTPTVSNVTVNVCTAGAALNFSGGVNTRVDLGSGLTTSLAGGTKVSLEAWVKPTNLSGTGCIIGNYSTGTSSNLQILLRRANSFYEFWVGNGASWYQTTSVATPTINVWQHVAATWDGTVAKIYVNGVLSGTTTPAISTLGTAVGNPVWIGGNTGGENFTGNIDEVRVWDVVRTQCEINTYRNCEIPTTATGLIANYHFNQGTDAGNNTSVTTLTDASASAYTGTLTNMALTGATANWVAPGGVTSGSVTPANLAITVGSTVTNSVICMSNSTTLSGTGADTYVWTGGVIDAVIFTPTVTSTYTVTGTNTVTGCTNTAAASITVNPLPVIISNPGNVHACGDVAATFGISSPGTNTYQWYFEYTQLPNDSALIDGSYTEIDFNTDTMTIQQLLTGNYNNYYVYCEVTNQFNCVSYSANDTIWANPLPTVAVNSGVICAGQSFTMSPSGAISYSYSAGTPIVSPTTTTSYTVTGDDNVCTNTAVSTVSVNALPVLTAVTNNTLLCVGQTATLSVSGATTYTWSTTDNSTTVAVSPTVQTTYTVNGTDVNGCSNTTTITQDVSLCTDISALSLNQEIGNIYPNPTNGLLNVVLSKSAYIVVMNAIGQEIIKENFIEGTHSLDLNQQASGIYFIKMTTGNAQTTVRINKL